ncbi:class I SAM-dependent methyltransferase [Nocardia amamiensis]|uniref:class I SAM-dependent methyltransferase n=1 Tax=Nocardia amamiensis TaxID=404578 RepID=UPI00082CACC5|nr:class I SAM-dependent methyltransferase [Nocardia amamiensis]
MRGDFKGMEGAYVAYRRGYPAAVFEYATRGLDAPIAVDVGAGSGLASAALLPHCRRVICVEPLRELRERIPHHPGLEVVDGHAEAIPLPDSTADLVVAAQAAHWFEEPAAGTEIRRVLRPGGRVCYLWKHPDPAEPYEALADEVLYTITGNAFDEIANIGIWRELLAPGWTHYQRRVFTTTVDYSIDDYIGYQTSRLTFVEKAGPHLDEVTQVLAQRLHHLAPIRERNNVYVVEAQREDTT